MHGSYYRVNHDGGTSASDYPAPCSIFHHLPYPNLKCLTVLYAHSIQNTIENSMQREKWAQLQLSSSYLQKQWSRFLALLLSQQRTPWSLNGTPAPPRALPPTTANQIASMNRKIPVDCIICQPPRLREHRTHLLREK